MNDDKAPLWQKIGAGTIAVLAAVCVILWRARFSADFVPLDASRVGPNLIASLIQWAVLFIVAVLVWPPTRRRLHRFADNKLGSIHEHLVKLHEHNEWHARLLAEQHRKVTGSEPPPHPHFDL